LDSATSEFIEIKQPIQQPIEIKQPSRLFNQTDSSLPKCQTGHV